MNTPHNLSPHSSKPVTGTSRNEWPFRLTRWIQVVLAMWCFGPGNNEAVAAPAEIPTGIELEWDPNLEPDVAGYKLYFGTVSGTYLNTLDAGDSTVVRVPELIAGFTYYFVVTAYSANGIESLPSNEVTTTVAPPPLLRITYLPRQADPDGIPNALQVRSFARMTNGVLSLTLDGAERTAVTVYASSDLESWAELGTVTNPTGHMIIEDFSSSGQPRFFYRFKQIEVPVVED